MKDYIKMMLEAEQLKFLVFAHHLTMLQACTEAAIEAKVTSSVLFFCFTFTFLFLKQHLQYQSKKKAGVPVVLTPREPHDVKRTSYCSIVIVLAIPRL